MSITALALATASWMSAAAFNAKEGKVYGDQKSCERSYSDCIDVTGQDMDYTSYQNGVFVEDGAKKRAKEDADAAWKAKVGAEKARGDFCLSFLKQVDVASMTKADQDNFVKCTIFSLKGFIK